MWLTPPAHGEHHITISRHKSLRFGEVEAMLMNGADHFGSSREAFVERLSSR